LFEHLFPDLTPLHLSLIGTVLSFIAAFLVLSTCRFILPVDHGRAYAVDGDKSKGKPTGAGLLFISVFFVFSMLFIPFRFEYLLYYVLMEITMLAGYLDDGSKHPWSEYRKGLIDLALSLLTSFTFCTFSSREIVFPILGNTIILPFAVYLILGTISINAFNCTDGVDGLSSSLAIVSIMSIGLFTVVIGTSTDWTGTLCIMTSVLIAYLWFNASPSQLLMGDAGSRAIGIFLAISIMQSGQPLLYLLFCFVILMDGLAGITKISLKRFLHISILKNTITPFHDHSRKKLGWSNQQVANRASIIQIIISFTYLAFVYISRSA
jgi:phospho-N-acetylmuramoyl-pentapeptide-transferase